MNVYVFTDGAWQPRSNLEKLIQKLANTLTALQQPEDQFGIQFIRFGNDPDGIERLERLDDLPETLPDLSRYSSID